METTTPTTTATTTTPTTKATTETTAVTTAAQYNFYQSEAEDIKMYAYKWPAASEFRCVLCTAKWSKTSSRPCSGSVGSCELINEDEEATDKPLQTWQMVPTVVLHPWVDEEWQCTSCPASWKRI